MYVHKQGYKGGVYDCPRYGCGFAFHAVTFIGWGTDEASGLDYWTVRNRSVGPPSPLPSSFPGAFLLLRWCFCCGAAGLCCTFADIVLVLMPAYSYTVLGVPACVCLSMCLSMHVSLLLLWLTGLDWLGWAQLG